MPTATVNCPRCGREASVTFPVEPAAVTTDIELDLVVESAPSRTVGDCPDDHRFVVYYYEDAGFEYLLDRSE